MRASAGAPLLLLALIAVASCSHGRPLPDAGREAGQSGEKRAAFVVHVARLDAPVAGARVEWRVSPEPWAPPSPASATTDDRGGAAFDLPEGRYFLFAQWRPDGDYARPITPGDLFAYFGGNPVHAGSGTRKELFVVLEDFRLPAPPVPVPAAGAGIAGRVTSGGSPVAGVAVAAYHRTETAFRDPGFAVSAPTGEDGIFLLDLPPGRYFLVARKRAAGGAAGPLRKGDGFGYYPANPVAVPAGGYAQVEIPLTILKLRNAPVWSGKYEAPSSIEGRILDAGGRPRKGVYAALYDNPGLLNRPVFLSDVTGEDGCYRLPVPVAGRYYLGARTGYGGQPAPGDFYGRYEGSPDHSIAVRKGDRLTGVDIVVNEVW